MSDQTVVAAPSAAEDVFNGQTPSLAEYSQYRQSGEVPERFKPAETADPAPAPETPEPSSEGDEPETASDSEPEQQQEKDKDKGKPKAKTAEDRIAQLEATIEKIKRGAGLTKTEAASSPEQPKEQPKAPQTYADWKQVFEPENWIAEYAKAHPEASYERANAAMFDHMIDVRDQFKAIEQQRESQAKELNAKVADARSRYGEKFDEVLVPTLTTILQDQGIKPAVKELINDSDVVADVIYALGNDPKQLEEFRAMSTTKQLRYIAILENGIIEGLGKQDAPRNDKGQFASKEPPAKPKTQAPKPPSPVSGVATGAFDVSDDNLPTDVWHAKRNAQIAARKG